MAIVRVLTMCLVCCLVGFIQFGCDSSVDSGDVDRVEDVGVSDAGKDSGDGDVLVSDRDTGDLRDIVEVRDVEDAQDGNVLDDTGEEADAEVGDAEDPAQIEMRFPIDLMLFYQGDSQHTPWFKDEFRPYVYWTKDGQVEWLFDGFLFLGLSTSWQGNTYYLDGETYRGDMMATKEVWLDWLETVFADGRGPHAVEQVLEDAAQQGDRAPYKRKVVFAIPYPVHENLPWGALEAPSLDSVGRRREMNFSKNADRLLAVEWFIERVLEKWAAQDYEHIELSGFYWLREEAFRTPDVELIGMVRQAIDRMNRKRGTRYEFYWIPYNSTNDNKAGQWSELGFDIGYFQPNYFFSPETPLSQLEQAVSFAEQHGMELEMEFTGKMYGPEKSVYLPRYHAYIDHFEQNGVWKSKRLAYYDSAGAWLYMATKATDPDVVAAYERMGVLLADRQNRYLEFLSH